MGANSGIGKATALGMAQHGFTVIMVCRNSEKGEQVQSEIKSRIGNQNIHLLVADLASKQQIYSLAKEF